LKIIFYSKQIDSVDIFMGKPSLKLAIQIFILIFTPIPIFIIININSGIFFINQIISNSSQSLIFIIIPLMLIFIAYQRKGWLKFIIIVGLLSLFYGFMLKWFWTTGYSEGATQIWGYLPTSDTISYYQEGYGLLIGDLLQSSATYRPLSTLFFSSLLWITNLNLMSTLWAIVYLNILGSLVASNEIYKTHGSLSASIYLVTGLLFYKFYIGTIMTEQVGFLLSNLAFACIWNGIQWKNLFKVLFGLFIISLGLNVRAGAMLILITIPVWIGFHFGNKIFSLKWFSIALIIAISGFFVNSLVTKIFTANTNPMFSNFGFTLYGVAVGNKGWYQIVLDYPGVKVADSINIAIEQIFRDPILFLKGVISTYTDYFNPSTCWAYCYLQISSKKRNFIIFILFFLSIVNIVKNWKKPLNSFYIFTLAGILLSVPFAPTRDVGYRTYTVTNPFLSVLLFLSFPWINQIWENLWNYNNKKITKMDQNNSVIRDSIVFLSYPLLTIFIGLALVLPFFTFNLRPLLTAPSQQLCAENEISVSFLTNRNAWIHVVPKADLPQNISIPYATYRTLSSIADNSPYHVKRSFSAFKRYLKPGQSIGYVPYYYNNNNNNNDKPVFRLVMAIVNTEDLPLNKGWLQFCGRDISTKSKESNPIKTYTATNLNENCKTCGKAIYDQRIDLLSSFGIILLIVIIIFDYVYTQFTYRKEK